MPSFVLFFFLLVRPKNGYILFINVKVIGSAAFRDSHAICASPTDSQELFRHLYRLRLFSNGPYTFQIMDAN